MTPFNFFIWFRIVYRNSAADRGFRPLKLARSSKEAFGVCQAKPRPDIDIPPPCNSVGGGGGGGGGGGISAVGGTPLVVWLTVKEQLFSALAWSCLQPGLTPLDWPEVVSGKQAVVAVLVLGAWGENVWVLWRTGWLDCSASNTAAAGLQGRLRTAAGRPSCCAAVTAATDNQLTTSSNSSNSPPLLPSSSSSN